MLFGGKTGPVSYFVVRFEGGPYEDVSPLTFLDEVRSGVPIFGFKVGATRLIYDRILRRYGLSGWRAVSPTGQQSYPWPSF